MGDKIRVVGIDRMVFDADAETLEPKACSYYDAFCFTNPLEGDISFEQWCERRARAALGKGGE